MNHMLINAGNVKESDVFLVAYIKEEIPEQKK